MILLDTHAFVWWANDERRLSATARRLVRRSQKLLVSPVSFWEIAMLVGKGRLELDRPLSAWASDALAEPDLELAELTPTAAMTAGALVADGFHGDPADCLVYATAHERVVPLISKDQRMRDLASAHGDVTVVW